MQRGCYIALALAGLLAQQGCAGDGPPPSGGGSTFDAIQREIFSVSCVSGGCHDSTTRAGNMVLEPGQSYANLVGVVPDNPTARAAGLRRVVAGSPAQSFLLIKLTGPSLGEGSPMPLSGAPLSAADIEQIQAWIAAGAPGSDIATPTASPTPSATVSDTPTATSTATPTLPNSPTFTITVPPTATPSGTRPPTSTPTNTVPPSPTPSATGTPTPSATATVIPTPTFSVDSTLPQIQATIFTPTCLDLGCHNARDRAGNQVLEMGQAYADLVGTAPANDGARADGLLRVDPGHPENSFLITKLTLASVFDARFGSRMPLGKPVLDPAQIDHIRAWILRGALPDEQPPASAAAP